MAQVRNVSNDKRFVGGRAVDLDELLDVPDEDFFDRAWPTSTWVLVKPPTSGHDVSPADAICWTATEPEAGPTPEPTPAPEPDGQE